jgi:hypothetical protein
VLGRVKAGSLRLVEAAELMGLSYRHAKRVWKRYRAMGAKGLRHLGCGRESNPPVTLKTGNLFILGMPEMRRLP